MDVQITKMNGDSFRLSEYDVTVRDFIVGSIPVTGLYGTVEGRAGTVDYGADFGQRPITVPFYMEANDMADYPLLRDELFALVISQEPFYIREIRRAEYQTGDNRLISGKRYKVRIAGEFNIEQQFRYGFGELAFETVDLPYAESVGTTQDIQRDGISSESELWGFGIGLQSDDKTLDYTFSGTDFPVFNAGNVGIHPFMQEMKITIKNTEESTGYIELKNKTNGTSIRINEGIKDDQIISINGANVTINNLVIDPRKTNRGVLQISPGWNEFTILGAAGINIDFDFRFYYF
ncbi:hypothetical protein JOC34_002809 [Virgibacillus halotolerans]|uniref:phage tail domain-containing protein n=1 Tax=Virgibacillus halotolerans TaxID=1071053 RepID=UPI001961FC66|nr:phage tail domain-containing protein [Virgibacillus halotolerans]MBM7600418.1 hypothetical protein [Virgibacillus halotolerans]